MKNKKRTGTKAYVAWQSMRNRCRNKNSPNYHRYGARGITICDRWEHFPNFLGDMGKPESGYSLDRINVDGNYTPENCRWANGRTQQRNRANNSLLDAYGVVLTYAEWSEVSGLYPDTLSDRMRRVCASQKDNSILTDPLRHVTSRRPEMRSVDCDSSEALLSLSQSIAEESERVAKIERDNYLLRRLIDFILREENQYSVISKNFKDSSGSRIVLGDPSPKDYEIADLDNLEIEEGE